MIRYEIKKIFSKSLSKVSLVVLLFSLLISCYFAITNVSFLDEQGKSHTGIAAAKSLREEKQKWKGCNSKSRTDGTIGACLNRANSVCLNLRSQNVTSNKVEL